LGPPGTTVTQRVLEETCTFSANQTIYKERKGPDAVMPWTWYWLWNDGLFETCATKGDCGVAKFPEIYTDGYCWLDKGQDAMLPCAPGADHYEPGKPLPNTLRTLFSWHARFGKFEDECVQVNKPSLAGAVRRQIQEILAEGLDMGGRSLFPGSGYVI
jgi:hypothetical protein